MRLWIIPLLLFCLKLCSLLRNLRLGLPLPRGLGWVLYFFAWPGMRPESFEKRASSSKTISSSFVGGLTFLVLGFFFQGVLILSWNILPKYIGRDLTLYFGLLSFLFVIHLGFSQTLYSILRLAGWPVEPLFDSPLQSTTLREFWGHRWNLAFVDMNKRLFMPLFRHWNTPLPLLGIFVASGILHELGISYPAAGGWGTPTLYFVLHGFLLLAEPFFKISSKPRVLQKIWVWGSLLGPLPLLFHRRFLEAFVEPYFEWGHNHFISLAPVEALYWALVFCGVGHLLVLGASFQVPEKLNWKVELARLGPFNRKIFWTYGGYIVFCIVAFALADLFNGRGLLEKHPSSLVIATFIALFWTGRVVVDIGYFKHTDWPKGDAFVIGHICLTALFLCLALTHWGVVVWQLV